jgi:hypothetical protein
VPEHATVSEAASAARNIATAAVLSTEAARCLKQASMPFNHQIDPALV